MAGSNIVGYERDEPFPLGGTYPMRYCLACYRPDQGLRVHPLTRQALMADFRSSREKGMTNVGGMDLCSNCGKRLLESDAPMNPEEVKNTLNQMADIGQSIALMLDAPYWSEKEYERLRRIAGDVYRLRQALERRLRAQEQNVGNNSV